MTTNKINKSEIMRNAWSIFRRGYGAHALIKIRSFSDALKQSWKDAKDSIKKMAKIAEQQLNRFKPVNAWENVKSSNFDMNGAAAYYANTQDRRNYNFTGD